MIEVEAPGKLVVSGEYAVLLGSPAIALAVDVPARATVREADSCRLEVAGEGGWDFSWDRRGLPDWRDGPPGGGRGLVLDAVAGALADAGLGLHQSVAIELDTRAFYTAEGGKLGLGSSAAILAALTAALCAATGTPLAGGTLFEMALIGHRRLQGGRGSGIDVATSVHGGVVGLVPDKEVSALAWPVGLYWFAAWSGYSAATLPLLRRFDAYCRRYGRSDDGQAMLGDLQKAAERVFSVWQEGNAEDALKALAEYARMMVAVDLVARIGLATRVHRKMAFLAAEAGCVYKISGAGGGDFGLVLATDPAALERAAHDFEEAGFQLLRGSTSVPGLQLLS